MTNGRITLRDIYDITNRIEDKLDKVEERVSVLEIWRANIMGKIAVIGAVVVLVVNCGFEFVKEKLFRK